MEVFVMPSAFVPRTSHNSRSYIATSGKVRDKHYKSIEELPQWIQERYAVLRLLEEREPSSLGMWRVGNRGFKDETLFLYIVPQPGDPEWEK